MALKKKLKMAELLAGAEFIKKKQSAKINEEKLKLEEKLAKSKANVKILDDLDIEEVERFHYDHVYSSQELVEFHDKHYFTTQKDDQALIGQGSHHHGMQQKLQIPRHIASENLASRTWEKDEGLFYSQDKATVKMDRCHNPKVLESEDISQLLCKLLKLHAAHRAI